MAINQNRTREVFEKLSRSLTKLSSKPTPKNVHQFRTYSRRLQALLEDLVTEPSRNDKKLQKLISRLRKRAGRIRDLDAQISALRILKLTDKSGNKAQLLRSMCATRARREKKLSKIFDRETVHELRKRLKRTAATIKISQETQPLQVALGLLSAQQQGPLTELRLHQHRVLCKRVRYLAEFAATTPETERAVKELQRMQDALGEWHDWLTLTQTAEERFGSVRESDLVAALRNLTRARFRHAVEVVVQTRSELFHKPAAPDARPSSSVIRDSARAAIA